MRTPRLELISIIYIAYVTVYLSVPLGNFEKLQSSRCDDGSVVCLSECCHDGEWTLLGNIAYIWTKIIMVSNSTVVATIIQTESILVFCYFIKGCSMIMKYYFFQLGNLTTL